jgi:hypothetical protein
VNADPHVYPGMTMTPEFIVSEITNLLGVVVNFERQNDDGATHQGNS